MSVYQFIFILPGFLPCILHGTFNKQLVTKNLFLTRNMLPSRYVYCAIMQRLIVQLCSHSCLLPSVMENVFIYGLFSLCVSCLEQSSLAPGSTWWWTSSSLRWSQPFPPSIWPVALWSSALLWPASHSWVSWVPSRKIDVSSYLWVFVLLFCNLFCGFHWPFVIDWPYSCGLTPLVTSSCLMCHSPAVFPGEGCHGSILSRSDQIIFPRRQILLPRCYIVSIICLRMRA